MDLILSSQDAVQAHIEIAFRLDTMSMTPVQYEGLVAANKAIAAVFCVDYIGINDLHLRKE